MPHWQPLFWDLAVEPTGALLARDEMWLQALAVVRAEREDADAFSQVVDEVVTRIQLLRGDEEIRRQDLLWFVVSWVLRRRPRKEAEQLIRDLETAQTNLNRRQELQTMRETLGKIWEDEVAEAFLRARREDVRVVLEERFSPVPAALLARLEAVDDTERLQRLMRHALRVEALTDLDL